MTPVPEIFDFNANKRPLMYVAWNNEEADPLATGSAKE